MSVVSGLGQGVALRSAGPITSCWTSSPWFRLDRLAELAGRLNQLGEGDAGCGEGGCVESLSGMGRRAFR